MSFGPLKEQRGSQIDYGGIGKGLIAAFRFAENGGTVLYDCAGNNHFQASFLNSPTWSFGPRGPAVAFSGTAEAKMLNIPNSIPKSGVTLVCLGMTTGSGNQAYVTIGDGSGSGYLGLGVGGVVGFAPYSFATSVGNTSGSVVASGTWVHMVATFAPLRRQLWQNGVKKAESTDGWAIPTITSRADIASFGAAASTLQGRIDHVYVFGRILGAVEIAALYSDPDVILYHPRKFFIFIPPTTGTGSGTLAALTDVGSGTVANPISGSGAPTLAALTSTGSGTVANPITGSGAVTLDALTSTGSGVVANPITGSGASTLDAATVVAAGNQVSPVTGTAAFTLDALTGAGTGTYSIAGSGASTLGALTVVASGDLGPGGTAAFTLEALTLVGSGTYQPAVAGSGSFILEDLIVQGDGGIVEDQTGTGADTLGSVSVVGSGTVVSPITGVGSIHLHSASVVSGHGSASNPGGTQDYADMPAPLIGHRRRFLTRNDATKMESERIRTRRIFTDPLPLFEVQWGFTEDEFDTFKEWFEDVLRNGADPFFLATYEILDDTHFVREVDWVLAFMGPYSWSGSDNSFVVTGTLEVIERVVLPESIVNPTNPPPPETLVPELEHTFEEFACQEMFHLKATGLEVTKAHTIEIASSSTGPWRPHVYFTAPGDGIIDFTFNNDYDGHIWFRIKRDHDAKIVRRPTNPPGSFVPAPTVTITHTQFALAGTWSDMAYNAGSATNQRINRHAYYIVPRGRVMSNSGPSLDPEPTPRIVAFNTSSGITTRWTRDNTDPEIDTIYPNYDGVEDNIAVQRNDFGYAVRARSFALGGCKSPITLILVDKAVFHRPWTTMNGAAADEVDSCDVPYDANVRTVWTKVDGVFTNGLEKHTFESADSCDQFKPKGIREHVIADCRAGHAAVSHELVFFRSTTETFAFTRVFLGSGDSGDLYLGFDQDSAVCSCFHAGSCTLYRNDVYWDQFPKCFTNSTMGFGIPDTGFGLYIVNGNTSDFAVITGPGGSALAIQTSWTSDAVAVQGTPAEPPNHIRDAVKPFLEGDDDASIRYSVYIILTLHNDAQAPYPLFDLPPLPPITHVPYVAPVNREDFEEYPSIATAELVANLNRGSGFIGSWVIKNVTVDRGFETFEEYDVTTLIPERPTASGLNGADGFTGSWVIVPSLKTYGLDSFEGYQKDYLTTSFVNFEVLGVLNAGSGLAGYAGTEWNGFWLIKDAARIYGLDTFEAEALGVIDDVLHVFEHGTGWLIYWTIGGSIGEPGYETWETYSIASVPDETSTLGGGTRWTGYWKFRGVKTYGLDSFETYTAGSFTTGAAGISWNASSAWTVEDI